MRFSSRTDAGRRLAERIGRMDWHDPLVLALPRGGVPVGAEVAEALGVPLEVLVVRKLGAPSRPELAVGALAEGGSLYVDEELFRELGLTPAKLAELVDVAAAELARRGTLYRGARQLPEVRRRSVIVVDDGVATGATALAAVRALRERDAGRVALAVPVIPADRLDAVGREFDELIYLDAPAMLGAVSESYEAFPQVTDEEVLAILERSRQAASAAPPTRLPVRIPVPGASLEGELALPSSARGLVIFAHGSGSSRHSPRNQHVAQRLYEAGFATLLMDLLTAREEAQESLGADLRFDIGLLAQRLEAATRWAVGQPATRGLPLGYFGASTGAAAALNAAAALPEYLRAVVSRGGRPDLADPERLDRVRAPTLFIVGSLDREVLALNRSARERMRQARSRVTVIPGASHLFEEPGALDAVAELAATWFTDTLGTRQAEDVHPPG